MKKTEDLNFFGCFNESLLKTGVKFQEIDQNISNLFNILLTVEFPEHLLTQFSTRLNLSEKESFIIFIEYLKFLIMKHFNSNSLIIPSFLVNQLWRDHFTLTKHYRDLFMNIFNSEIIIYTPIPTTNEEFKEAYESTQIVYQSTFQSSWNKFVWKDISEEIQLNIKEYLNVNLLRLVIYNVYDLNLQGVYENYDGLAKNYLLLKEDHPTLNHEELVDLMHSKEEMSGKF